MLRALALLIAWGALGGASGCCCLHHKLWAIHAGLCGCDGCGCPSGYAAGSACCCHYGCGEYYAGDYGYGHRCDPCDCYGNYVGPGGSMAPVAVPHSAGRSRPAVSSPGSRTQGTPSRSTREPLPPVPTTSDVEANSRPPRRLHGV